MPSPLPRRDCLGVVVLLFLQAAAAFPEFWPGRLPHYPFRGLLSVYSRYGLRTRRVAQGDPFHRRLQQFRYLHRRSDCYRLERQLPGGICTH